MGCDIHMVLERRTKDGWVGLHAFPCIYGQLHRNEAAVTGEPFWPVRSRNYALFAALAGVRGEGPAPRGIPDDVSALARYEIDGWGSDGHSHSWLLMSEALPIFREYQLDRIAASYAMDTGRSWSEYDDLSCFGVPEIADDEFDEATGKPVAGWLDNYRLVFWFDN